MKRMAVGAVCIFCVGTVLTQLMGLTYLAARGQLTRQVFTDIGDILKGIDIRGEGETESGTKGIPDSTDDLMEKRIARVWEIHRREGERKAIQDMVDRRAQDLTKEQAGFAAKQAAFADQLKRIADELNAESAEQSRGILVKLPAADAVQSLMKLELEQNVTLLKGLEDRAIAKLLQEFAASTDQKTVTRGQEIFEAITQGQPKRKVVANANTLSPAPKPIPKQQP